MDENNDYLDYKMSVAITTFEILLKNQLNLAFCV